MRYFALACDYDGTLAHHGRVQADVVDALERLRNTGRQLLLVTGRELEELKQLFPRLDLFERVVAENGALVYRPETAEIKVLCDPPPQAFVDALRSRGVRPLSVGHAIVATWEPHQTDVLEAIHEHGLELHVIFNKGAVMVLPSGVNKAFGLGAAVDSLNLSLHNVVGVGDAENDHAFLQVCECSVAVSNALDVLKQKVDLVTEGDHGRGVIELIHRMIERDLSDVPLRVDTDRVRLGKANEGQAVLLRPYGQTVLLIGASGSGKSTLATSFLESLNEYGYQFCIIDPEGDYEGFPGAVTLGEPKTAPGPDAVAKLFEKPSENGVLNLLSLPMEERPARFNEILSVLVDLRSHIGRPHWLIIDEAHHLVPPEWRPKAHTTPDHLHGALLITVHPDHIALPILEQVDVVIAVGDSATEDIAKFCKAASVAVPDLPAPPYGSAAALYWNRHVEGPAVVFQSERPESERTRHKRKYAEGDMSPEISFYFRGPHHDLYLRAQNLMMFLQIADGVDDATWVYHLRRGDYSRWFRDIVKDDGLAEAAGAIEADESLSPKRSRQRMREEVEERYTRSA